MTPRSADCPRILHVTTDDVPGGVRSNLESLFASRLNADFQFSQTLLQDAQATLARQPVGLVVFHSACSWGNLNRLIALKRRARVIVLEHHYCKSFEEQVPSLQRFHLMLRIHYEAADRVVAISRAQGEWMLQNKLVSPGKLTIIPQAKCLDLFLAVPPGSIERPLRLGAYGRFSWEKGFDVLIEALKLIPGAPLRVLLGGDGPERSFLESLAASLPNLEFCGLIRDVPEFSGSYADLVKQGFVITSSGIPSLLTTPHPAKTSGSTGPCPLDQTSAASASSTGLPALPPDHYITPRQAHS